MKPGTAISSGALMLAAAVAAGAFGAHALAARLDTRHLDLWQTAARYLAYAGVGSVLAGLVGGGRAGRLAAALLVVGGLIFAGTVGALALGGPRVLGAVTPLGGVAMIAGFLALAWAGRRRSP